MPCTALALAFSRTDRNEAGHASRRCGPQRLPASACALAGQRRAHFERRRPLRRHLLEADIAACAARRETVAQLGALEAAVAGACGLAMVYCVPALRLAPAYTAFLERLAAAGHRRAARASCM